LAWLAFVTLALHAPFVAHSLPDDTWMLSVAVAATSAPAYHVRPPTLSVMA